MPCQSGRSAGTLVGLLLVAATAPAGAGPTGWAHQAAGFQSDGAVTVKSLAGGTYAGTQNPTGAVAKANQNAATQAPTVIIQATGSQVAPVFFTSATFNGNLGGLAGANAKCSAEFGAGWKFADAGKLVTGAQPSTQLAAWVKMSYAGGDCQGWITGGSDSGPRIVNSGSVWSVQLVGCSNVMPIACTSL